MTHYVFTSVERRFASIITGASATANSLSSRSSLHKQVGCAEGANDDEADGLEPQLCICLGARVISTDNIWVENGLVNGSMGTVRDVVWNEGQDPIKDMPTAIMVEVDDYDGPKLPVTRRFEYKKRDCSRTNFLLRLAYRLLPSSYERCPQ